MTRKTIDVTAAVIIKGGKVLAARRGPGKHLEGYWEFPGGKLEENESPESCLERELTEEFSISSRVGLYVGESVHDYGEKTIRLLCYEVEHLAGEFKLVDHDQLRWLEFDQLDEVEWAPADVPLVAKWKARTESNGYYSKHADEYCEETSKFDVGGLYLPFLKHLGVGAHILDLGCGSGRDSKAFRNLRYTVTSVDGSPEVAAWASIFTGHPVKVKSFESIDYHQKFDGVWASASLLHCHKVHLQRVIENILESLKDSGVAYMSFKWGELPSVDERGRYFTNYTTRSLAEFLAEIPKVEVLQIWDSEIMLRGKPQRWVYALIRKCGIDS